MKAHVYHLPNGPATIVSRAPLRNEAGPSMEVGGIRYKVYEIEPEAWRLLEMFYDGRGAGIYRWDEVQHLFEEVGE